MVDRTVEWTRKRVVARVGTYTDRSGEEKGQWLDCGTLWLKDGEPASLVLLAIPAPRFNEQRDVNEYSFALFDPEPPREKEEPRAKSKPASRPGRKAPAEDLNDDIPF